MAVSGKRQQEPSFFSVSCGATQAVHTAESLSKGGRVVVVGRLEQRAWTAEDGSARSVVEVMAEELGPSLQGVDRHAGDFADSLGLDPRGGRIACATASADTASLGSAAAAFAVPAPFRVPEALPVVE